MGEGAGEGLEGGAHGGGEAGAGGGGAGLDAEDDDLAGAIGEVGAELAERSGMGTEIAGGDGGGIEALKRAGGQAEIGGIEENQDFGMKTANQAGEIFRSGGGVDALPVGMAEGAGKDRAEGIIAVAGISDAEEEVHGGGEKGDRVQGGGGLADLIPPWHRAMGAERFTGEKSRIL